MAKWNVEGIYEYAGTVEADTEEEAYDAFLSNLNFHYVGTYELKIEQEEEED